MTEQADGIHIMSSVLVTPVPLLLASLLSVLLLCGLPVLMAGPGRGRRALAFISGISGLMLGLGIAVVTHKFLDVTEIAIALSIGVIAGFVLGYWGPLTQANRLIPAFMALLGISMLGVGMAIRLNPFSFGLISAIDAPVPPAVLLGSGASIMLAMAVVAGALLLCLSGEKAIGRRAMRYWAALMAAALLSSGLWLYDIPGSDGMIWLMLLAGTVAGGAMLFPMAGKRKVMAITLLAHIAGGALLLIGMLLHIILLIAAGIWVMLITAILFFRAWRDE